MEVHLQERVLQNVGNVQVVVHLVVARVLLPVVLNQDLRSLVTDIFTVKRHHLIILMLRSVLLYGQHHLHQPGEEQGSFLRIVTVLLLGRFKVDL